jgi:hypothetical protein
LGCRTPWNHPSRPTPRRQGSPRGQHCGAQPGAGGIPAAPRTGRSRRGGPAGEGAQGQQGDRYRERGLGKCRGRPALRGTVRRSGRPVMSHGGQTAGGEEAARWGEARPSGGGVRGGSQVWVGKAPMSRAGRRSGTASPAPCPPSPHLHPTQQARRPGPDPRLCGLWGARASARSHDRRGAGRRLAGPHVRAAPPPRPPREPAPPRARAPHLQRRGPA